jgi:hypothetical protein
MNYFPDKEWAYAHHGARRGGTEATEKSLFFSDDL